MHGSALLGTSVCKLHACEDVVYLAGLTIGYACRFAWIRPCVQHTQSILLQNPVEFALIGLLFV